MIISRYLNKEIWCTLLTVMAVLLFAFLCQQVVRYLNYVAVGKIPTNVLLELIGLEIPYLLTLLLPLGLYLGILLTYGRLYADNEMVILQLGGFSHQQLLQFTIAFAAIISTVVWVLMLWVNPFVAAKRQQVMSSDEATMHMVQTLMPGRFQTSLDNRHVIYVEKLSRDRQRAHHVFLALEQKNAAHTEPHSWVLVLAKEGYQIRGKRSSDPFFVMADGYRYEGVPGRNDFKLIQFKRYGIRLPKNNEQSRYEHDETLSSLQLWQQYAHPEYAAELQWRLSVGLSTMVLAILAIPLSRIRPRQGRYIILLPAILIYIIYINLLLVAQRWVEQQVVPVSIGMWWVHGALLFFVMMTTYFSAKNK